MGLLLLGLICSVFIHWASIFAIAFFLVFVFDAKGGALFYAAFSAVFLLWFVTAFYKSMQDDHLSSSYLSETFGGLHPILFLFLFSMIAGLVAGLTALSAHCIKLLFLKK